MPFFSVVIPLYNKEDYIEDTLKSVLDQTFQDFEVIIVNDGSTDKSLEKVNQFDDSRIRVFSQENQGVSVARNFGIEKSNTEFIALLDADDLWLPNHLQNLHNLIKKFPNCGIYCSRYAIKINKTLFKKIKLKKIQDSYCGIIENYFASNLYDPITHTSAIVIPKHIFRKTNFFDIKIKSGQDTYLWTQIALEFSVALSDKLTSIYSQNDSGLSNSDHVKDRLLFLDKFREEEGKNKDLKAYLDMNRYAVALNYKLNNNSRIADLIYNDIDKKNINFKQKLVYNLPKKIIWFILQIKRKLYNNGFFLHLYR